MLNGILCFGQVSCSPFLLGHCAELGIAVTFLTEYGRFLCQMQGPVREIFYFVAHSTGLRIIITNQQFWLACSS